MDLKILIKTNDMQIVNHYKTFIEKNLERNDSGLDLPMISNGSVKMNAKGVILPLGVHIIALKNDRRVPYYLCPRSSLPLKTPLRLANSIGVIDCGYNGELKAIVDHCGGDQGHAYGANNFEFKHGDRLFQVVSPTLEPHRSIEIITSIDEYLTSRNEGGFGSTG